MNKFNYILDKLANFTKKYYTNELIKGVILFFAIGLLYLIATLLIEHFLWLSQSGRTLLFWAFILFQFYLFARFIAFPIAKLLKLQKGIDQTEASRIIGNHFPEVSDKLLNLLQLKQNSQQSELLLASIEQKSQELQPIPFTSAVNFSQNVKYLKYAAIPVLIILLFVFTGNTNVFSGSYERVVNYKIAYDPPAPFRFYVVNEKLEALENKPFTLNVRVAGDVIPEIASIVYNNETYFLQQTAVGEFQYTFSRPTDALNFKLQANSVISKPYTLDVIKVPTLVSFEMQLDYPRYTLKQNEILKSTGNATVPEGTKITWKLNTRETNKVHLNSTGASIPFSIERTQFKLSKSVFSKLDYTISTSNDLLNDYENLAFSIQVVKDQHPEIFVESRQDSLNSQITYFFGRVSDDYGLTKLQLVYYPSEMDDKKKYHSISINSGNFDQFLYAFPGELELEEGTVYSYYFEVYDNDGINKPKSTKSTVFTFRKLTQDELEKQQLKEQQETIQGLDNTLQNMDQQNQDLEELKRMQKEKKELSWNDKQKLEEFLKRQKLQEEMMKKFSEKAKENLENFQKENQNKDPQKEELKNRFEENEQRLQENENLLKELEKLQEKIAEEELFDKLKELSKQNKKQQRNLEQLLELTKRYYVEKKAQKLAEELEKLADKQEALSKESKDQNTKEKQEALNKEFEDYKEEIQELREENEKLKSPLDIPDNSAQEEEVQQEQQDATDKLDQQEGGAEENQKKAADKMREMSQQMQMQMAAGASEGDQEDIDMLRQVLDNLVIFSISQEDLMEKFRIARYGNPLFGTKLVRQSELKQNFQHVDDSLFALALRNPTIGPTINDLIEEVHFSMDKSTVELADNKIRNGVASQQYAITGANDLAVLLSDALSNMQMQMQMGMGQGEGGQGKGFQLPDIIKQQESLNEKMEEGTNQGEEGDQGEQQGEGEGDGDGDGDGQGDSGSDGDGDGGESGDGDKDGEQGSGNMGSEQMNEMLFEIYKQQQLLRMQLEERLREEGLPADARNLIRQMEQVEQELLERGFNKATLRKMNEIKHQLLKLEKAAFQQGEDEKRQGRTNEAEFQNTLNKQLENAKNYFNNVEILNRQQLPLRQVYRQKVQEYFNTTND